MIPCFICGKDAETGWSAGFVPAPDSQKLALCADHDTPLARREVEKAWLERHVREIAAFAEVSRQKAAPAPLLATVCFTGGGMLSFTCIEITPTGHGTLKIHQIDGTLTFLPMQHIREYSVRPALPQAPS